MQQHTKTCFNCGEPNKENLLTLYDYTICQSCKSNLGLFHDKTLQRHLLTYKKLREEDPNHISYQDEIKRRLDFIDKDYIKKKIKLLHVQERLDHLT